MANEITIIIELLKRTGNIYLGILLGGLIIRSPLQKYRKEFVKITINVAIPFLIIISFLEIKFDSSDWIFPVIAGVL
ncbi:MAG: hypothetical protein ACXAD7_26430, partial [Candidatus Kariarchaeaceae archaeon]